MLNDSDFEAALQNLFDVASEQIDPLVLDLNGNGEIDLNLSSTVYFDVDDDGFAEAVNWVAATDGMLAIDANSNGNIDNITELFGSATEDGFSALSFYDSNSDDIIDSNDTIWADLVVWQDVNQDGYSQSGELLSLSSLSILSINLASVVNAGGNDPAITHDGTITTATGTMRVSNVLFDVDAVNTRFNGDYTLDIDTLFLPTLRGYGHVADMHVAASIDSSTDSNGDTIKDKLEAIAGYNLIDLITDYGDVKATVDTLLLHWAGVEDIALNSRGGYLQDARRLEFFETLLREDFVNPHNDTNPEVFQASFINQMWDKAVNEYAARLVMQATFAQVFTNGVHYDLSADEIVMDGDLELSQGTLDALSLHATALSTTSERSEFWQSFARILGNVAETLGLSGFGLDSIEEAKLDTAIMDSDPTLTWYAEDHGVGGLLSVESSLNGISGLVMPGTSGNDTVNGSALNDHIYTEAGNDTIDGGDGDDHITGGMGDDTIDGGDGDDEIWADDTITSIYGDDTVYGGDGNDYIVGGMGEDTLHGEDGNDIIYGDVSGGSGGPLDDVIDGGLGNDHLLGEEGDDTLIDGYGGTGQNIMNGGYGYNIYRVVGGGAEVWIEAGEGVLEVPAAYADEDDLTITRDGDFLKIVGAISGSEITVLIANQFGTVAMVDKIRFASSYEFDLQTHVSTMLGVPTQYDDVIQSADTSPGNTYADTIYALAGNDIVYGNGGGDTLYGEDGDDTLYGEAGWDYLVGGNGNDILDSGSGGGYAGGEDGNDTLIGGSGNDSLNGGAGNDTYVIAANGGTDYLAESIGGGSDTIELEGFNPNDVRIWMETGGVINLITASNLIRLSAGTTGNGEHESAIGQHFERVLFDNATIWNLTAGLTFTGTNSSEYGYGTAQNDTIYGLAGSDALYGNAGNDTIYGGDDGDSIIGGDGNDTLYGEDGDDWLEGNAGNDILHAGSGNDSLYGGDGDDTLEGGSGNNFLSGGDGQDILTGYAGDDRLYGGAGADTLDGGDDNDELNGHAGNDTLTGGDGNDELYGEAGADILTGGAGDDDVYGGDDDDVMIFTSGYDVLNGGNGNDLADYRQFVSAIWLDISVGGALWTLDTSNVVQGPGDVWRIMGYATNTEHITATNFDDMIWGNASDNILSGESGNDDLYGQNGNDTILGGGGIDNLTGGSGADSFVFEDGSAFSGIDNIFDFNTGQSDTIDLTSLLAEYDPLTDAITDFVEITTSGSNSVLKVDVDGGGNSFVQIATIVGVTGLTDEAALVTSGNLIVS